MSSARLYAVCGAELVSLPVAEANRDIHALLEDAPPGIYTAFRSYRGRFLGLEAHLGRCQEGMARAGYATSFDREELTGAIAAAAELDVGSDVRLRLDLLERPTCRAGVTSGVLLAVGEHQPVPEAILREGAELALAPAGLARPEPVIKFSEWVRARRVCERPGSRAYEYLLSDGDGRLLEGTSSNFYLVLGNKLVTAADGILLGITRKFVFELCAKRGLELELRRPALAELGRADEAFMTSSTREVVPVTRVAEQVIGTGQPGPIVTGLMADYTAYARASAMPAAVTRRPAS